MTSEAERIEEESFRIITDILNDIPYPQSEIVKRVVHTTADPQFADLLVFKGRPIEKGIEAIKAGKAIITDVNMVRSGITLPILSRFGGDVRCFISDERVLALSKEEGITRARAVFRVFSDELNGNIMVIGNAPTALFELIRLYKEEGIRPAVVVGVPVGFVGARKAKEELLETDLPSIVVSGERGGSTVAVAITNAILRLADKEVEV